MYVIRVLLAVVKVAEDWPTPERIAEKMAAKREGTRNWKSVPFVSITPLLFILPLSLLCPRQQIKPTAVPMAIAAPGL